MVADSPANVGKALEAYSEAEKGEPSLAPLTNSQSAIVECPSQTLAAA